MSDYMDKSPRAKRQFYSQPEIAKAYDEQRFGGASGAWVNAREIEIALGLVTPFHRALDLGCGTGRLMRAMAPHGKVVGVDTSRAMLEQAAHAPLTNGCIGGTSLAQADAFSLPFADGSFDAAIALRFVFHFANIESLLREVARVLAPRGVIVFDVYVWSPRALVSLDSARWGGRVYAHSARLIEQTALHLGLRIADKEHAFLFSPYIYRLFPLALVRTLERIETRVPARLRSRIFWKLERTE